MKPIKLIKGIYWKCGLFLMTFLCPIFAFADVDPFFKIADKDVSLGMLKSIFGDMGGVLPGTPSIFNVMFKDFNNALLVLAIIVVIYVIIFGIINTAKQGEFMGGKNDSIWTLIRATIGIILVIPGATGYATIQVIMMWVVLQGVGVADQLWGSTVAYFKDNALFNVSDEGSAITKSFVTNPTAYNTAVLVLNSLSCMHQLYRSYDDSMTIADDSENPQLLARSSSLAVYTFVPTKVNSSYVDSDCGNVTFPSVTDSGISQGVVDAYKTGLGEMMIVLNNVAKQQAFNANLDAKNFYGTGNPISTSAEELENLVFQAKVKDNVDSDKTVWTDEFIKTLTDNGWANAGLYYFDIASRLKKNISVQLDDVTVQQESTCSNKTLGNIICPGTTTFIGNLYGDALSQLINNFTANENLGVKASAWSSSQASQNWVRFINAWADFILGGDTSSVLYNPDKGLFGKLNTAHPIIRIAQVGNVMCTDVTWIVWIIFALSIIGPIASVVFGALVALLPGAQEAGLVLMLLPIMGPIVFIVAVLFFPVAVAMLGTLVVGLAVGLGAFYVAGLTMSVYVPLIPFIIFVFAVIGWLISVVETMLAAPMVAIGLTFPGGQNEILGRAEPGVQLLANVFLRPALMIFGFIAGILVSYVAINFLTSLFGGIITELGNHIGTPGLGPVQATLFIVIYISFIIAILNRSFSLIHIFPDRILSWISFQGQFGEYSKQAEQEVHGAFSKAAGMAQEPVKGMVAAPMEEGKAVAKEGAGEAKSAIKTAVAPGAGGTITPG